MIWHFLRYILSLTVPAFYRKIQFLHPERIPDKNPAILSFNHPNAFTDPLGITFGIWPIRTWYMARGDVFKNGIISTILENIGIVPIFRMRDGGKEGLEKNDESYQRVFRLLKKNKKVIVFSEGLCVQERRLRTIKKGVPRMVMAAWEQVKNPNLTLVPVGLFYEKPHRFGSDWLFHVGEPINLEPWYKKYQDDPARTLYLFRQFLEDEMKKLVIHIQNPKNDILAEQLENLYLHEYLYFNHVRRNPKERYELAHKITDALNNCKDDLKMDELRKKVGEVFEYCHHHRIRPWMSDTYFFKRLKFSDYFLIFLLLLFLPVYLLSAFLFYLPEKLSLFLTRKIVKSKEFFSSFLIGIGSFLFLFYFILIALVLSLKFSDTRYPIFIPAFFSLLIPASFYFKCKVFYLKIFYYLWKGRAKEVSESRRKIEECKRLWQELTNFKL